MRLFFLLSTLAPAVVFANAVQTMQLEAPESLPKQAIVSIAITPPELRFAHGREYGQILVTAKLADGGSADVTRLAKISAEGAVVSATGIVTPKADGNGKVTVSLGGQSVEIPLSIAGASLKPDVDFIQDVNPVLTKMGCNSGACHGAKDGKYGFKLSLRGYDPIYDLRSLKDDLAGRRLNPASPDDSLMLLKAVAAVPHEGGQRTRIGEKYYEIMRAWIAGGARLDMGVPRVTGIDVFPKNPVVAEPGARQQFRVVATFADGRQRDVTQDAFIESGNMDVLSVSAETSGLTKTLRRGEAPILARYEGSYAATTLTVMGDRTGFEFRQPETWGRVDELVASKWQRMKIEPSGLCSDADFIRRVHLDLTGLPPSAEAVRAFMADASPVRMKRDALVDRLIGSPEYVEHWTNKWADLLQVNSKFLGGGVKLFREWIRNEIAANTPYDVFVKKVITATGSNKDNPAASYWKILRDPAEAMENTTHLFLATRFNCNKCHDHPFERWTQDQYYTMGAFFAQIKLDADPASGGAKIAGSAVEKSRALYEIVSDKTDGEMIHERTTKIAPPAFPYPAKAELSGTRREQLAAWMTSPDNRYFASSYANRLWGYLMGVGLIEPLDDIRAGNPPSNPELLDHLTREFIASKFDVRHVLRMICKSRTYQLSVAANRWNEDDKTNYSHALARRLPAEVLYDSVLAVTGAGSRLPGGVRASMLADSQSDLPSGFLANAGRPTRESSCECERSSDLRLGSVMALLSGPAVADAIGDPANALAKLVSAQTDDRKLVDDLFVRVLNRPATDAEIEKALPVFNDAEKDHGTLTAALAAKEKEQAPAIATAEAARLAAIESAKNDLARYEAELAPKLAEAEKNRQTAIAAAAAAVKEYETKNLAAATAAFAETAPISRTYTGWQALELIESRATGGIVLTKLPDGSIRASGERPSQTDYVVKADTKLAGITGLMLEVIPSPEEKNFGPGRFPADGNFVLGELGVKVGDFGTGANSVDAKFVGAVADFNQANFEVAKAIDGRRGDGNNGWAVSGGQGSPRFAAFTFEKALGNSEKGTRFRIEMNQPRPGGFSLAGFRIWVTTATAPAQVGYPQAVVDALRKAPSTRTDSDRATVAAYWAAYDPELSKRRLGLGLAQLPLPVDPGLIQKRDAVAKAELPVKLDATLLQLRADVLQSEAQVANKRLTGAQDLVWALINTPAFLFNR
jgi:hypothetical protein